MEKKKETTAVSEKLTEEPEQVQDKTDEEEFPEFSFRDAMAAIGTFLDRFSWVFLLLGSVLLIGYYVLLPSRTVYHSDTTDTLMWAIASYEGKSLFNPDFNYACLLPFGTSLIMTALIPLFGVSMTTHVLGMLGFFLLFTGALIWMCRSMDWSWKWTSVMTFAVLMLLSGSEKLREIFWGHTIYYSLGVFFIFAGLAMLFRYMDASAALQGNSDSAAAKKSGKKALIYFIMLAVWFILTGMNQTISITIFSLPVLAAIFCERWLDTSDKLFCGKNRRTLLLFVILAVCMAIGYVITSIAAGDIGAGYQSAYSTYSNMDGWMDNLLKFPNQWLGLMGVSIKDGEPLFSGSSIQNLILLIAHVVILVLPLLALIFYKKIEDAKFRILILTHWFVTLLIMLGYICGKLSSANWRLTPIAATAIVVSVAFLRWSISKISLQRMIPLMMVPVFMACLINAAVILKMKPYGYKDAVLYKLADALEMNGLDYGYATFWRANSITVISDSKVECRDVNISDTGITPRKYQNLNSWYKDQPDQEKYFLLMTMTEKQILEDSGSEVLSMPHEEIFAEGYAIWVFEENIFEE
ncbi:MAG: hypothetical protein IKK51_09380 [Oscillospiraceae bacterium]|nr:hypothetical protein [Oscillospiraceae bacterium]